MSFDKVKVQNGYTFFFFFFFFFGGGGRGGGMLEFRTYFRYV